MYMFGAVIVIYLVGVLIYQGYLWIKKKREKNVMKRLKEVTSNG